MTAFASKLREGLQDAGLYLGVAMIFFGLIGAALHFLKDRRGGYKVEPIDLLQLSVIGAFLFILLAGVAIVWERNQSKSSHQVPETAFRLTLRGLNITQIIDAQSPFKSAAAINAQIWNIGAPSAAVNWSLVIITPDGRRVSSQLMGIVGTVRFGLTTLDEKNALENMTSTNSIGTVPKSGELEFFSPLTVGEIENLKNQIELSVEDVYGRRTTVTRTLGSFGPITRLGSPTTVAAPSPQSPQGTPRRKRP